MLKFLDHDETYDPAFRRIIRDGGIKYDGKRDDGFPVRWHSSNCGFETLS